MEAITKLSPKQKLVMKWAHMERYKDKKALICDGSVRSGKTVSMIIGFVHWAMAKFDGKNFAVCGKTVGSAYRNVITPLLSMPDVKDYYTLSYRRSDSLLTVRSGNRTNNFYVFGGKDESSFSLIQGITLSGAFFDEVALMPRSFVEQAIARTLSEPLSRYWFNCNPDSSEHWFYKEWICKADEKNALHLHFTMHDNPILTQEAIESAENLYTGVFYQRYIQGLWVLAEGLIYPMFSKELHVIPDTVPDLGYGDYYISCDYGTLNPTAIGLWHLSPQGHAIKLREYYYDARKEGQPRTDEEHYKELETLAGSLLPFVRAVIVDPSAASFIECIRRHNKFRVRHADNSVLDGIRDTAALLDLGRLKFCECCKDTIREFSLYRWDEKQTSDKPIKENDHAMDETRYFVRTAMKRTLKQIALEMG